MKGKKVAGSSRWFTFPFLLFYLEAVRNVVDNLHVTDSFMSYIYTTLLGRKRWLLQRMVITLQASLLASRVETRATRTFTSVTCYSTLLVLINLSIHRYPSCA